MLPKENEQFEIDDQICKQENNVVECVMNHVGDKEPKLAAKVKNAKVGIYETHVAYLCGIGFVHLANACH